MRISISCLQCEEWFDNLLDLVQHRAFHDANTRPDADASPGRPNTRVAATSMSGPASSSRKKETT